MKVVDVCAFYTARGGGVKTYVDLKLAHARTVDQEMVVIAPGESDRVDKLPGRSKIIWVAAPTLPVDRNYRYFANNAQLHAILSDEKPDLVEVSSPWRSASIVAEWPGPAPRVLFMHADPLATFAYRWFEDFAGPSVVDRSFDWYWQHLRRLDKSYAAIISAGASLSERLTAGGLRRVVTNPMGIDPTLFSPANRDLALRNRLLEACGLPSSATLLIGVGRYAPEKRWPMVAKAVSAAGCTRALGLVIVGDGRDRGRILRAVGGNPHILLHAPTTSRDQLARLVASADALVHGMESETFCIVAAEARASGTPLIVPDRGGAADQVGSAGGWVYQAGKPGSLSAAIVDFIDGTGAMYVPPAAPAARPRTMTDHFHDLFASYAGLVNKTRSMPDASLRPPPRQARSRTAAPIASPARRPIALR